LELAQESRICVRPDAARALHFWPRRGNLRVPNFFFVFFASVASNTHTASYLRVTLTRGRLQPPALEVFFKSSLLLMAWCTRGALKALLLVGCMLALAQGGSFINFPTTGRTNKVYISCLLPAIPYFPSLRSFVVVFLPFFSYCQLRTPTLSLLAVQLYIPSRTDVAAPLFVMLHGCTQNPTDFATGMPTPSATRLVVCLLTRHCAQAPR
jgi:hypothetical protein